MSRHTSPISGLRHVALAVEGFDTVVDFYSRLWGLELVAGDDRVAYLGSPIGPERYLLRIRKGDGKRVDFVSFASTSRGEVDDLAGRLVRTLVDEDKPQGSFEAVWDGRDASGREVSSGTYLARLSFGGRVETVRMGLVR